jgi:hypothetical protein
MMNDPEKDVKTVNTPDVTQSSYMEQDKLSMEYDELVGNFAQGSAGVNREGNAQTVGGAAMMSQTAGSVSDYGLRVFFETWMEPVLKQLMKLEQAYENELLKFGIHEVTDELIRQDLVVRVNVGMGNTDPIRRVERLLFGLEKAASLPKMAEKMKPDEAANEIFGSLGYKDASRFFMNEQQLEEKMAQAGDQTPPDVKIKQEEIQIRREDNNLRHQRELMKLDMEAQLGFARLALEKQMTLEKLYATLGMEKQKMLSERQRAAVS